MVSEPGQASADGARLNIERKLNLDLAEDRRELITACTPLDYLKRLVEDHLDNYLRWFKAPEWRLVYSGGMMTGPEPRGRHFRMSSSLERLLETTLKLELLQDFSDFDKLIASLDNPSQVAATIFEIEVAAWCATRHHHENLTFSPRVNKSTGIKYPDFLWHTTIGSLYCECKQLNMWQRTESQRTAAIMSTAAEKMGDAELWPKEIRMEVLINGHFKSDSEERLKTIVERQASDVRQGLHPEQFQDDTFTVAVRDRSETPLPLADSITGYQVQVGTVPVRLDNLQSAHLVVTKSTGMARARALRDFVKEAKKQLPDSGPGGVFVEMPAGVDMAALKLQEMLGQSAHQAVVWASIWMASTPVRAVWRDGQPFDARMIEPSADAQGN